MYVRELAKKEIQGEGRRRRAPQHGHSPIVEAAAISTGTVIGDSIAAAMCKIGGWLDIKAFPTNLDAEAEDAYWRQELMRRGYFDQEHSFEDDYAPALGFAYVMRPTYLPWTFDQAAAELGSYWPVARGKSRLEWPQACAAVADVWIRCDHLIQVSGTEFQHTDEGARLI